MKIEAKGETSAIKPSLSHIEGHEEDEAKRLVNQQLFEITGKPGAPSICGYLIGIKVYIRPEDIKTITRDDGTTAKLYRPGGKFDLDRFTSGVGLVVGVGPQAYRGKDQFGNDRFPEGPWCKVGDWVVFPRYESTQISWRDIPLVTVADEKVCMVVADPTDVRFGDVSMDKV